MPVAASAIIFEPQRLVSAEKFVTLHLSPHQRSFGIQLSEIRNILRASRAALFRAIHAQGVAAEYAGARRQLSVLRVLGLAFFRIDIAHHSHVVLYRNCSREA